MIELQTDRLRLLALSDQQLRRYLETPDQLEIELGIPVSRAVVTARVQRAIQMKLDKMAYVHPDRWSWYTYWLIIVHTIPFGAGLAGFKGFPDQYGESEIGYGIDPAYQGKGYMTEAAHCLIQWAFCEPACQAVVARDTKKWNMASRRILEKVGMRVYAESEDALWYRLDRSQDK